MRIALWEKGLGEIVSNIIFWLYIFAFQKHSGFVTLVVELYKLMYKEQLFLHACMKA